MSASSAHTANTTRSTRRPSETRRAAPIQPIRSAADHQAALAEIERLMHARKGAPEGDRLDVLATLVEAWEARHVPIAAPDPIAAIQFMMEQKGLTRRDLEPAIGSRARVAEILNKRRALTLPMIRALGPLLDLPADVLVQAYPCSVTRAGRASPAARPRGSVPKRRRTPRG
jgi:HTH-type transcriptional regulator / antitoxin HigA